LIKISQQLYSNPTHFGILHLAHSWTVRVISWTQSHKNCAGSCLESEIEKKHCRITESTEEEEEEEEEE
jgi:hypothetical protein